MMKNLSNYILEKYKISKYTVPKKYIDKGEKALLISIEKGLTNQGDFEVWYDIVVITKIDNNSIFIKYEENDREVKFDIVTNQESFIAINDDDNNYYAKELIFDKNTAIKLFKNILKRKNRVFYTDLDKHNYLINGFSQDNYEEKINKIIEELSK